jgi:alkylated DNA repair dioxygenase AlkB
MWGPPGADATGLTPTSGSNSTHTWWPEPGFGDIALPVSHPGTTFDHVEFDRIQLDDASWIDVARGFLSDHTAAFEELLAQVAWSRGSVYTYDHARSQNYSAGSVRNAAAHPALLLTHKALRGHYGHELLGPTLVHYRDGREAMGVHRDTDMRWLDDTLIGILTLGAQRPFVLRPKGSRDGDPAIDVSPAGGDLLVMGGRAQADWLHGVPPARGVTGARISAQWRWTSRTGRPQTGGGSQVARKYGHGR